MKSLEKLEMHL